MKKSGSSLKRFFLYFSVFLLGAAAGIMLHDSAMRTLRTALAFGVTDLSGRPPERLTEPLVLLGGEGQKGLLPAGVVLYPDLAYPEGFLRYTLHINFKGVLPSESVDFGRGVAAPAWAEAEKQLLPE